jgi:hypothetical protein
LNESGLQLMSSNNVNIAFDNRFVARTALPPVSPGQSFDVLFGIHHGVQVCVNYYSHYCLKTSISTTARKSIENIATSTATSILYFLK